MKFQQLALPGMPVRIVLSAVWTGPTTPCTVRASLDAPSDQFSSVMEGIDVEGLFTLEELVDVIVTLVYEVTKPLEEQHEGSSLVRNS